MTGMKYLYIYITALFCLLVNPLHATNAYEGDSPVAGMLESHKESKILEGTKFKIAKPFIKKTPMGVIIDEIKMMIIYPLDKDDFSLPKEISQALNQYIQVREIDDERSTMTIYIDVPKDDRFSEIILYNTRPDPSIILFMGDFTVESLIKVGEASEQERKHLRKNK